MKLFFWKIGCNEMEAFMFSFNYAEGATTFSVWGIWFVVFGGLFLFNELSRRLKWVGFFSFIILPVILSILWATILREVTYTAVSYTHLRAHETDSYLV